MNIYYDGDCPFCSAYARLIQIREHVGDINLIDLRDDSQSRLRMKSSGIDLDKGMVVEYEGRIWHGAEAMNLLACLSIPSGFLGRLNLMVFRYSWLSSLLYPLLRIFRNSSLLMLSKRPLREGYRCEKKLLSVFFLGWGIFSCLHFIINGTEYLVSDSGTWGAVLYPSTWLILVFGFLLVLFPSDRRLFIGLIAAMLVDAVLQAPLSSNHTIIKNFFLLAVLVSGIYHSFAGNGFQLFFRDLAPVGRSLLVLMYVFGVWHKINSSFLDPDVSCARALWQKMPIFLSLVDHDMVYYVGIYGTLIVEAAILILLLLPHMRWLGIVAGILFHSLLALSEYAFYSPFSMLSVALHLLFVSPSAAIAMVKSRQWEVMVRSPLWMRAMVYGGWFAIIYWLASYGLYTAAAVIWLLGMSGFFIMVIRHARDHDTRTWRDMLFSRLSMANLVALLFLFNCVTPYLGLKTAQSINMFANLRLEGGVSNHLVLSAPPGPFKYLEDIVELTDSGGSQKLRYIQQENLRLVYYDLLAELEDNPRAWASYIRDGRHFERQDAQSLATEIDKLLHPKWFRKWFHFSPVDLTTPKPCGPNR